MDEQAAQKMDWWLRTLLFDLLIVIAQVRASVGPSGMQTQPQRLELVNIPSRHPIMALTKAVTLALFIHVVGSLYMRMWPWLWLHST